MRVTAVAFACLALAAPARGDEGDKRKKGEDPIRVIKLDRKAPVAYEKDIEPIFVNKCNYCHSGNLKEGKLDLASYETLMRGGKRGSAVTPGKAAESLLYKVSSKSHRPFMPPRSEKPLSPEELALLKLWIDQGAKAPAGGRAVVKVVLKAPAASVTPVLGVALSPDKEPLVAAARGNQVHVWESKTGQHVRALLAPKLAGPDGKPVAAAHLSLVESVAWSKDGKWLATGSYQEVALWDAKSGELKHKLGGFADRVVSLAFSHDGKLLAAGGGEPTQEGEIKLVEVESGKVARQIKDNAHSDTVFGVAFSPDDKMLASCGADKFVKVYEVGTGKFLKAFEGHTDHVLGVGFSGDGKLIASGGADKVVKIWDYGRGEQVRTINAHTKQVTALAYIGKSNNFATAGGDQLVRFWNANGGNTRNFSAGNDFQYCVAVSADEALVASGGQDGTVRLYNGRTGAAVRTLLPPGAEKDKDKKPAEGRKIKK